MTATTQEPRDTVSRGPRAHLIGLQAGTRALLDRRPDLADFSSVGVVLADAGWTA